MGRLPSTFAGRVITYREPYAMEGVKLITSAQTGQQYQPGTFTHAADKPFEIHRLIPRVYAYDANNVIVPVEDQPDQSYLQALIKVKIQDLGKTMPLMQTSTYLASLVKGTSEMTWEFAEPCYLAKGEFFEIVIDADTFPVFASENITQLQVRLNWEGFQLVLGPPVGP